MLFRSAEVAELRTQLLTQEKHPDFIDAGTQLPVIRQQIELLNAKVEQKGTFVRDLREVERELSRLKESIALARNPQSMAPVMPGADAAGAPEGLEDPSPVLLGLAADMLTVDLQAAAGLMRDRCVQYFSALTERRYMSVEWDREGRTSVVGGSSRRIPVGELPPREVDLLYLSLRLTVVEKLSARVKLPLIIEDAFPGVDEARLPLLGRMLKHLGTLTQVLHVTAAPSFAPLADTTVNL